VRTYLQIEPPPREIGQPARSLEEVKYQVVNALVSVRGNLLQQQNDAGDRTLCRTFDIVVKVKTYAGSVSCKVICDSNVLNDPLLGAVAEV